MEELVRRSNPWWLGEVDDAVRRWEESRVRWFPKWVWHLSTKPFSLNFVFGPRQVGKTMGLKLLIRELARERKPASIFYFNCDFLPDMDALRRLLDFYLSLARAEGVGEKLIFLDEATSVAGWWRIIKGYIDANLLRDSVVTVAGSSSLRLKGEVELFPGRRGLGRDVAVLPLSFREFAEVHGLRFELSGRLEDDMVLLSLHKQELTGLFEVYMKLGGFPLSVNRDTRAEEYFLSGLEGEVLRAGRSWPLSRGILASVMRKAPSPISFSAIGADVGVSYKTAEDYLELFRRLFLIEMAPLRAADRVLWRREKKIFFLDPFAARTIAAWCGVRPLEASLYEWVIQAHGVRRFGEVFYYRNTYEVDCIFGGLALEVKAGKPHRRYPKGVKILEYEDIPVFLYAVG